MMKFFLKKKYDWQSELGALDGQIRDARAVYGWQPTIAHQAFLAGLLYQRACMLYASGRTAAAHEAIDETIALLAMPAGRNVYDHQATYAAAIARKAHFHFSEKRYAEAEGGFQQALAQYRIPLAGSDEYVLEIAECLRSLAEVHHARGDFGEALTAITQAREIYRDVQISTQAAVGAELSTASSQAGEYYAALARYDEAVQALDESLLLEQDFQKSAKLRNTPKIHDLRKRRAAYLELQKP